MRDEIADVLTKGGDLAHGYTHSGHPAATAAALANLEIIEREKLVERVRDDVGPYLQQKLASLAGHRAVSEVRGFELIGALEFVPRGGRAELTPTTLLGVKAAGLIREEGVVGARTVARGSLGRAASRSRWRLPGHRSRQLCARSRTRRRGTSSAFADLRAPRLVLHPHHQGVAP